MGWYLKTGQTKEEIEAGRRYERNRRRLFRIIYYILIISAMYGLYLLISRY
jgi:hypothetical protein